VFVDISSTDITKGGDLSLSCFGTNSGINSTILGEEF